MVDPTRPVVPWQAQAQAAVGLPAELVRVADVRVHPLRLGYWDPGEVLAAELGRPLALTQEHAGQFEATLWLAAGTMLEAVRPAPGWTGQVSVGSESTREVRERLALQGRRVVEVAGLAAAAARVESVQAFSALSGAVLEPTQTLPGVFVFAEEAVGSMLVSYQVRQLRVTVPVSDAGAPWGGRREELLRRWLVSGRALPLEDEMPRLQLDVLASRAVAGQRQQMQVQADGALALAAHVRIWGVHPLRDGEPTPQAVDEAAGVTLQERSRSVRRVRVESSQTPGAWVDVDVASSITLERTDAQGRGQRWVLRLAVPGGST